MVFLFNFSYAAGLDPAALAPTPADPVATGRSISAQPRAGRLHPPSAPCLLHLLAANEAAGASPCRPSPPPPLSVFSTPKDAVDPVATNPRPPSPTSTSPDPAAPPVLKRQPRPRHCRGGAIRSLSCKAASASPETVSISSPAPPAPTAGSPLRPFGLLRAQIPEEASPSPKTSSAAASAPAGSVLKRRRPAPLMVPVDGPVAAAVAVAAVESDPRNEVEEEGDEFAVYCRRGKGRRRVEMEDRHVAKVALGGDPKVAFFAVFDGHGGNSAAEFAAENMPKFMADEMKKVGGGDNGEIEGAVKKGYLKTDEEFLKREESGGACCVTALLQKGGLTVSNTGDCRAVLSRAGKAEALTTDHRASREDEKERIENLVKESLKLRQIMQTILTLGNALNQGTARGSAVGFRLDSLLKLSDTRARNKKMTLMHYLCKKYLI